jgi:putative adenylate-forming enzyme
MDFAFYDLLEGLEVAVPRLIQNAPDVLVAPATVLRSLAELAQRGLLPVRPKHVISVAEVLEEADADAVRVALGVRPHQLYQATEGFLGYTCEAGTLHLNESFLHVEPEWLDPECTRFQPVITDFSRTTQLIVRYRLNDVIRTAPVPCPCGRAERAVAAVEGRTDEVLRLPDVAGRGASEIYPDLVRRAMALAGGHFTEYSIRQRGNRWQVDLLACGDFEKACASAASALNALCERTRVRLPALDFGVWRPPPAGAKRRRILVERGLEART